MILPFSSSVSLLSNIQLLSYSLHAHGKGAGERCGGVKAKRTYAKIKNALVWQTAHIFYHNLNLWLASKHQWMSGVKWSSAKWDRHYKKCFRLFRLALVWKQLLFALLNWHHWPVLKALKTNSIIRESHSWRMA